MVRNNNINTIPTISNLVGKIVISGIKKGLYNFTSDLICDIKDVLVKLAKKQRELKEREKQLKEKYEKREN